MTIEVGDTVQLKSGGPIMTVETIHDGSSPGGRDISCVWFDKVGSKRVVGRNSFPEITLEKATPGSAFIGSIGRA